MSGRGVRRSGSETAESVIRLAANARKSLPRSKILLSGAFAGLVVAVALPALFVAGVPPVAADGTLKCYDRAGNYEPCVTQANVSPARLAARSTEDRTTESRTTEGRSPVAVQPPSWTTIALYQQSNWETAVHQQVNWGTPVNQQESWTTSESEQPANSTSAPVGRRTVRWGKRQAMAACRRHLIPCIFTTLRKGLTHIASAAASLAQPRPAREHL